MHSESGETSLKFFSEHNSTKMQKCKFCPSYFGTVNEYLSHIEEIHDKEEIHKKNAFMCSDCGKQYKTKNELTQHINSKCGTIRQFKCKICDQELMSAGSLYNHMLRHNGVRSFMCRFCAKLFFTAGQLKVHERIHTQDKAYICEVCSKGFCHRQSLITHSTLHTGIKPYQCENCGNSFSCVGNLIKHRKTHADTCGLIPLTTHRVKHPSTKIKVRINTPLNSRLKTGEKNKEVQMVLENLKTEIRKEIEEVKEEQSAEVAAEPETKCECSEEIKYYSEDDEKSPEDHDTFTDVYPESPEQVYKVEDALKKKYSRNPEYDKILADFVQEHNFDKMGYGDCKYCKKRYSNIRWFYKHVKNHENNSSKEGVTTDGVPVHKCSCCKMSFYTKEENMVHQQTSHADILTCNECCKIFANRDSLRSHQKVFHKGFGRKAYTYICEKCGKQFKQKSNLKAHEQGNCEKGPLYECTVCKKQFSTVYTRNNHMRVHDPEKKLFCKYCPKTFHWKGQLKIHERSHTGEKPFACLYCPKAFAYRESLITHSSIHTGIKPHLCEGCGSRFSCIGNLIKHRSTHANECGAWKYQNQTENKAVT